ncbi:alpha/beta hydrolase [Shimazuella sp. AN120528]|uniref:alpha/beta fold hydrolase n=1 Tax=Shimazuella soli TaxID=1892854 RepID=UPI001F100934|nr:alpha/beta hydrolase [Shimazuella soli]MCH5585376.1 alpha/beta hydrolase [Shimazuella soli]
MPYFESKDQTKLFYREWGEGKPVIFISGWSLSSTMWNYQMIDLSSKGIRCIAYDRRGHGRSDDPGKGYDYDTLTDDLRALIEHLDLHKVTLIGHSMGSGEVVRYLTRFASDRIEKIVLLAGSVPYPVKSEDNPEAFDRQLFEVVRSSWKKDFPLWLIENEPGYFGYELPDCSVSPQIGEWTRSDMLQTSLKAILDFHLAGITTNFTDEVAKIDVPTLIIHGDRDESMPIEFCGAISAQLIPNNKFIVYENAPHGLYITHRERLNKDLLEFIK